MERGCRVSGARKFLAGRSFSADHSRLFAFIRGSSYSVALSLHALWDGYLHGDSTRPLTWFLRKVTAVDVGESSGGERRLLRRRALRCKPVITFALWQRPLVLVQSFEVHADLLRLGSVT